MSVTRWKEVHYGRGGGDALNTDFSVDKDITRVFHADTDSNYDTAKTVLSYGSCPNLGAQHPSDLTLYVNERKATNEEGKRHWVVTIGYTNEEFAENPLDEPAKTSWDTEIFQQVAETDVDGEAVVNAAGQYFDPPIMKDDFRLSATVRKNVVAVPAWVLEYLNKTNLAAFTLDGMTFTAGQAKLAKLSLSEPQERNDITYRVLTMLFQFKEDTWVEEPLNQGMMEKPTSGNILQKIKDRNGQEVTKPVPLDANGRALWRTLPVTPANCTYMSYVIYGPKDFSVLPVT